MGKFNTHGGYFAPTGYFRVDAGGSHEENPNGGVQIGVDQNGTPNMLEEDEPVYNDYVYSDNIKADAAMLKKYNLPAKYAGKLYSEIADKFVDEAEERPNDPVSNNGLNAMLVRLANSQEEQKKAQQQKELEEELANMSPEELEELEAMIAQQEQGIPEEEMMQEQTMEEQQAEYPMMANGGFLRVYGNGTPGELIDDAVLPEQYIPEDTTVRAMQHFNERQAMEDKIASGIDRFFNGPDNIIGGLGSLDLFGGAAVAKVSKAISAEKRLAKALKATNEGVKAREAAATKDALKLAVDDAKKTMDTAQKELETITKDIEKYNRKGQFDKAAARTEDANKAMEAYHEARSAFKKASKDANPTWFSRNSGWIIPAAVGTAAIVGGASDTREGDGYAVYPAANKQQRSAGSSNIMILSGDKDPLDFACGGKMNKYVLGGPKKRTIMPTAAGAMFTQPIYEPGMYSYFSDEPVYNTGKVGWVRYPLEGQATELPATLPSNVVEPAVKQASESPVTTAAASGRARVRYTAPARKTVENIPVVNNTDLLSRAALASVMKPAITETPSTGGIGIIDDYFGRDVVEEPIFEPEVETAINKFKANQPVPIASDSTNATAGNISPLATFPRYAGAITSGVMGLYNAFQEPDKYDLGEYNPVLPTGQMHLIDPVFNPLDENMATNTFLANAAGTQRALRNSGLGPSTGAAIVAADYNAGRNLGSTLTSIWDANNQRRNNVISQRNNNASAIGRFDYGVNRYRAHILNNAALTNLRNKYLEQRLNYEAEAQKYAAIQQQLDNVSKALAGIGRENTYLNQINFDDAYDYITGHNGVSAYAPNYGKCGGFIKKYKK